MRGCSPLHTHTHTPLSDCTPRVSLKLMTDSHRRCELSVVVVTEGFVFARWQLPAGEYTGERVGSGLFIMELGSGHTYTHGERLRSLLDDKAFDDMCEDLGLDDGLGRFVLSVVRRAARHGGRLALISWGHGWRWGPRCSTRPLGWATACWPRNEYKQHPVNVWEHVWWESLVDWVWIKLELKMNIWWFSLSNVIVNGIFFWFWTIGCFL